MLYYNNKKWSKSFDALLKSKDFHIDEEDKKEIEKLLNKGTTVYTTYCPYNMEMYVEGDTSAQWVLMWNTDKEELQRHFEQNAEDV